MFLQKKMSDFYQQTNTINQSINSDGNKKDEVSIKKKKLSVKLI